MARTPTPTGPKVLNAKELKAALAGKDMFAFEELTGVTAKQVRDLTDFDTETLESIRLGLELMK